MPKTIFSFFSGAGLLDLGFENANYNIAFVNVPRTPQINFYFNDQQIDITFPYDMLALAESIHEFKFSPNEEQLLNYGLSIKPWFIERVHRALVKAEAFKRLKKPHAYYSELLNKSSQRISNVLNATLSAEELTKWFYRILLEFYAVTDDKNKQEASVY